MKLSKTWGILATSCLLASLLLAPVARADAALEQETLQHLKTYLQINTSNPPGNEMASARFLKQLLDKEGIENQLFDLGHQRANLYAILRGDGSKKGLVLLHHMDVVPADPQYWSVPPFAAETRDGMLYGRGAIDVKAKGIVDLMTLIRLKRAKTPLKRDLIFLAVADEEVNSSGARAMIGPQRHLFKNAEFVLDEGETITESPDGKWQYAMVGIGEKSPLWLSLTFKGTPGHGSVPIADSSVNRALRAAGRILDFNQRQPFQVLPGLEESIRLQYAGDITALPGYTADLSIALKQPEFLQALAQDPNLNALIRNTISITGMSGSDKINIIPNEATLKLDCRLLPGYAKDRFLKDLQAVIGEPVEIKEEEYYAATYSPVNTELMRALTQVIQARHPGLPVVPTIFTSSTDSSLFRAIGLHVYGFESIPVDAAIADTAHGNDERVKISNLAVGLDLLHELVLELNR